MTPLDEALRTWRQGRVDVVMVAMPRGYMITYHTFVADRSWIPKEEKEEAYLFETPLPIYY